MTLLLKLKKGLTKWVIVVLSSQLNEPHINHNTKRIQKNLKISCHPLMIPGNILKKKLTIFWLFNNLFQGYT